MKHFGHVIIDEVRETDVVSPSPHVLRARAGSDARQRIEPPCLMLRRPSGLLLSRACARPSALLGCASHHGARCLHAPHTAARISPAARAAAAARSAHSSVQPLTLVDRARGAYAAYDGLLQSHSLLTTTATGAVLAFLGDACTQAATEANIMHDGYDISRGV